MSLDTKYRPKSFDDVLGQDGIITILRRYIVTGRSLHQSYLFAGPFGSGKTTLGRIMARALMCETPKVNGDPCDVCPSCVSILETGNSMDFIEVDAATNSGKADVQKITEEIQYSTFAGRRRIYLFDECFTEDAVLITRQGPRTIKDLVEERFSGEILSHDVGTGKDVWKPLIAWFDQGHRDLITLTFDNDVELVVTPNHQFYTNNRAWVRADELNDQDDVVEVALLVHLYAT